MQHWKKGKTRSIVTMAYDTLGIDPAVVCPSWSIYIRVAKRMHTANYMQVAHLFFFIFLGLRLNLLVVRLGSSETFI